MHLECRWWGESGRRVEWRKMGEDADLCETGFQDNLQKCQVGKMPDGWVWNLVEWKSYRMNE